MSVTLVLPDGISAAFDRMADSPLEAAGMLLVSVVRTSNGNMRLLARQFVPVPKAAYVERHSDGLLIDSEGYVPALGLAETLGAAAIFVHTHPGTDAQPLPSQYDLEVDRQLSETCRVRTGSLWYGALILSPGLSGLRFSGHIASSSGEAHPISRLWKVGDRFAFSCAHGQVSCAPLAMFDRNVRAFGPAIQATLNGLVIGIVGCGGTGSAVAEMLVRLGVRHFVLLDPDRLTESNVTRVYGSSPADIGVLKVEVTRANIARIAPTAKVRTVASALTRPQVARELIPCDVIFGCTDDNAGRLVLSRIPTYLLTPVIDCGVLLSSGEAGVLAGIDGRVTTIVPEAACLLCRNRVDLARAGAELMTPDERERLEDEGYAPALGQTEPAVVTFTSAVASGAVAELLERLIGYGPAPRPSEVLIRFHDREISTNLAVSNPGHYCALGSSKIGAGVGEPFLDLAWTE